MPHDRTKPNQDKCRSCFDDYYLEYAECRLRNIIYGCLVYREINTCERCNSLMYLDPVTNTCKIVDKPVEKCLVYISDGQCQVCKANYARKSNTECVLGNIKGCMLYSSPSKCIECYSNYFLDKSGNYHICANYSNDLNCKTPNKDKDESVDCNGKQQLNKNNKCVPILVCQKPSQVSEMLFLLFPEPARQEVPPSDQPKL